jgi:5-methylthioadenosine/S-adenosylhomocysteine deaminase
VSSANTGRTLIRGGDVVTMNPQRDVLVGGSVVVEDDRIIAIGSTSELEAAHADTITSTIDATGCIVTPGLVNAHHHLTGGPLVRGCIPDLLPAGASIFEWSVPLHGAHSPDDDEVSATVAAVDCVRNGITTVVEAGTIADVDRVAIGLDAVGIRATVGVWGWDIEEGPFAAPAAEVLDRQRHVVSQYPSGGLIEGWVTLVGHNLASDELLAGASDLARSVGTGMTMHMSPTSSDPEQYLARTGRRPLVHLNDLGVLGPHLLIAHGVWLDDDEIDVLLSTDTALAYCPWAYLRLGQGVCGHGRHGEIARRGGRVALGCDAANAGDSTDILRTAAVAAGIARDAQLDTMSFGAHDAFEMATIGGAKAIGMDDRIGSLEVGKQADIVVHDTSTTAWMPRRDPGLELVWGTDGRSVRDVMVDGRMVVENSRCVTVDEPALYEQAQQQHDSLLARAGITAPHRWPHHDAR